VAPTCCEITDQAFSDGEARQELRNYRRKGPPPQTRVLLDAIRATGIREATLLDIGGGIGTIHHELLEDVAHGATHVDASSAYLKQAKLETARLGHEAKARFVHADFTDVAGDLPDADIVTMDRVVCCYPDYRKLITAAALRTRRVLAMSYPRETWYTRILLRLVNALERLRRQPFRSHLHPQKEMDRLLSDCGLHRTFFNRLFLWEVALYRRD
jgi:2-polyprenyl-3-methyl-5-hydroxy-6-metoxy-1,4-benzoquinol methylase